jgi:hypothetical protein
MQVHVDQEYYAMMDGEYDMPTHGAPVYMGPQTERVLPSTVPLYTTPIHLPSHQWAGAPNLAAEVCSTPICTPLYLALSPPTLPPRL